MARFKNIESPFLILPFLSLNILLFSLLSVSGAHLSAILLFQLFLLGMTLELSELIAATVIGECDLPIVTQSFEYLGLVIGRKGRSAMKKKITYTEEPIKLVAAVKDFLPPQGKPALRDKTIRVTLNLNEESAKFFKEEARKERIPYQQLN